ncbi:inner membrane metabolite transport protein YdjE [mine drainage metagenome]|uniref:Inner membrane metabolite transport protein YdjE n=1 Tax=mine drainage metagenome TaxID=410659 RepID=A0A1J5RKG7_9ZZZZ
MDQSSASIRQAHQPTILARIDRLPHSRYLTSLVARIASGGWFEFYELFMPGFIAVGLVKAGIFKFGTGSVFDPALFSSFLASFFLGMFLSAAVFSFVSDRRGRRAIFVQSMVVYSIAQLAIAFLSDPLAIDVARFIAGLAVGMQLINNDSYITELVPRSSRGRYMTAAFIFILTAIPVSAFLAAGLVPHVFFGIEGWRIVVAIGALSGIVVLYVQHGLPESPRWLEVHGRFAEADKIVAGIEARVSAEQGGSLPAPSSDVPEAEQATGHWSEMFSRFYLPRTIIISIFQFSQTIAVFGFTAFVPQLLIKQGFTIVHSLFYTAIIVLLAPVGAGCAYFFSERIERKWQLVGAAILIGVSGTVFANAHTAAVVLLSGALIALGNNWMIAIFHPYAAELFPTRIRARAVGFTFSWSRISSIFVSYWVAGLLASFGPSGVFAMIGLAMAAIVISVGVFGPPTNGRSLEILSP